MSIKFITNLRLYILSKYKTSNPYVHLIPNSTAEKPLMHTRPLLSELFQVVKLVILFVFRNLIINAACVGLYDDQSANHRKSIQND